MFTGLVEELGEILKVQRGPDSAKLLIKANQVLKDIKLGDSIAVNGVCLTAVEYSHDMFTAEAMAETLAKTNLKYLQAGSKVNLERALRLSDRLGGHLVSGHVDGIGTIRKQTKHDIALVTYIEYPRAMAKYLIPKGSVAIDGISLTIVDVDSENFSVSLIPHTAGATTLGLKRIGDLVNLEADMIPKYLEGLIQHANKQAVGTKATDITTDFLQRNGFL